MGITTEMVRGMNITGNLSRNDTWASAIAKFQQQQPADAPATGSEITLAPASAIVPATPQQGAIVPHGGLTSKQIDAASKSVKRLLERYIVKTLSPEEGIEIYLDARAKLASDPKILQAFRSQSRNHQLLKVAVARYDREAELFEQLHDQYIASAPSSLGSMVSSISGGVSNVATAAGATVAATSTAASAMVDMATAGAAAGASVYSYLTGPQTQTQPTGPLALLDSSYDSDGNDSQSSLQSGYDTAENDTNVEIMSGLNLGGGNSYAVTSQPAQPTQPASFTGPFLDPGSVPAVPPMVSTATGAAPASWGPPVPALPPPPDASAPVPALPPPPDASAPVPALPPPPVASAPAPAPAAPIAGPATAPVSGAPISAPATAPAIISEAQVKAMTDNAKAIIDATNALTSATRKAKSLSPDQLAVLSDQLESNPAVQNLVSSGLLKWDDLLGKDVDGKSVIDFAKIQKVSSAMRERSQSVSANTKQTYQRFAEERVRPGYQTNTQLKGLLSFTGPRFMPPPPFKK
jgi:hypothetical protein